MPVGLDVVVNRLPVAHLQNCHQLLLLTGTGSVVPLDT